MAKIVNLAKKMLGFYSPYSWAQYLRIGFAAVALLAVLWAYTQLGNMGFFGALLFMIVFGGPAILLGLGAALAVGAVIAAVQGKKRSDANARELQTEGSGELIDLDRMRARLQAAAFFMKLLTWVLRIAGAIIFIVVGGSLTINGESVGGGGFVAVAAIAGILLAALSFYTGQKGKTYREGFKEKVARALLESILDDVDYRPGEYFNDVTVRACGLFGGNKIVCNGADYLTASYWGRPFTQDDLLR